MTTAGRALTMFVLLLTPLLMARGGTREQPPSAQQQLLQLERRWLDAEDDPDALQTILADDFIHVLPIGFVTKAEQLRFLHSHPAPHRGARHFEDLHVRIFGTAGVVNGIVVANSPDGKIHKTIFTDMFAYRHGKWQAVNAQELPLNDSR